MDLNESASAARASYKRPELYEQQKLNKNNGVYVSGRSNCEHKRLLAVLLACAYGNQHVASALLALGEQPVSDTQLKLWKRRFLQSGCVGVPLGDNCRGTGSQYLNHQRGQPDRQQVAWILVMRTLHPKMYVREIAAQFQLAFGRTISHDTINNVSRIWGLTRKVAQHVACEKFTAHNLAHYARLQVMQRVPFDARAAVIVDEVRTSAAAYCCHLLQPLIATSEMYTRPLTHMGATCRESLPTAAVWHAVLHPRLGWHSQTRRIGGQSNLLLA